MMHEMNEMEKALGFRFRDKRLLQQALVHGSFLNENPGFPMEANERLEFLGDALLGFIIADELYRRFPDLTEGNLTKLRSALVRRETLYALARGLGVGEHLLLSQGEASGGGRQKPSNLASALEAIVAAAYLDQGLDAARAMVLSLMAEEFASRLFDVRDYKSELQELLQSRKRALPEYALVETSGPEHARLFTVEVREAGSILGRGSGKTKKAAEAAAAQDALAQILRR